MNRRTLLKNLICGFSAPVAFGSEQASGAVFSGKKLSKIGLQLYTVRRDLEKDFAGTLRKVAALGISEVEFAGYFGQKPENIKKLLAELKLTSPSAHVNLENLRKDLPQIIADTKAAGHQYLILGYLPEPERKSLDDYKKLADLLNKTGEECRKSNLQFAYHNHDFEFARMENQIPYDLLLAQTDAQKVKMELDLYWITKVGFDPLYYFEKYPQRFPLVHVKDLDATPKKYFTEVGRGTIDFKKIFGRAKIGGVRHFFVEQDETPAAPLESVASSVKYLKKLNF